MTLVITGLGSLQLARVVVLGLGATGVGVAIPFAIHQTREYLEARAQAAWRAEYSIEPSIGNPEYDAFRHAYTSARLAQFFGLEAAKLFMDGNELVGANLPEERRKDFFNNDKSMELYGADPAIGNYADIDSVLTGKNGKVMASNETPLTHCFYRKNSLGSRGERKRTQRNIIESWEI